MLFRSVGSEISRTWPLPTRHTQSSTHPLLIDAWAKGEVFPGEVFKLDGDSGQDWGRTAQEMEGTAGWRSDGGGDGKRNGESSGWACGGHMPGV